VKKIVNGGRGEAYVSESRKWRLQLCNWYNVIWFFLMHGDFHSFLSHNWT